MKTKYFFFFVLMLAMTGSLTAQGTNPGTSNLTHSWTFDDGTANDNVGHAHGTLVGGATISGGSLVTSAQGQWMEMPGSVIDLHTYNEITLEAWYTPAKGANPNFTMLAFFGNTQNSIGVNYYFMTAARLDSVSRTAISCGNTSTPWSAETGVNGSEYNDGKLHHMVSTLTGDSIKLYIDGTLTGARQLDTNNTISRISSTYAYLAKSGYTGDAQWIGRIHEFNIYNKALNSAEVLFLFHQDLPGTSNLTHSWTFDDGTAKDYVGHTDGKLVGGATISGGSLVTSAQGQWMEMPADTIALHTYNESTLEAWYTPMKGANPNFTMLVFFGNTQNSIGVNYYFMTAARLDSVSRTAISCGNTSTPWSAETGVNGPEYNDGKLHHMVSTLTGDSIKLYIDGTLTGARQLDTNNTISRISSTFAYLAKSGYTGDAQWIGRIHEFNIYGKALDSTQVRFLFQKGVYTLPGNDTVVVKDTVNVWQGPAIASGMSKFIGCTYNGTDPSFSNYWTQVTPGNAGKFGSVAGSSSDSSKWNWTALDAAYSLAVQNHLTFKDHNLIWGQQQPSWLTAAGFDSAHQVASIEQWIRMVGNRYPKMQMIDVVNEPLLGHNPATYKAALGGAGATGWDWVIWAFQKARLYMPPNTKLLINDYGIINDNSATTSYLQIINLLQARGLIDGIGVQGHRFELENADTTLVKNNLNRLAATGLPIYISEFDLGNLGNTGTPDDNQQLQLYQKVFPILWRHPGVKGITIWDYLEGQTWQTTCYLVRANGTARPALFWLAQFVKNNPTGVELTAPGVPSQYQLAQNYPNPFNPATTIRFELPARTPVTLEIYNILGVKVRTLIHGEMMSADVHQMEWNGKNDEGISVASGVYLYRLHAGTFQVSKKMMLLK